MMRCIICESNKWENVDEHREKPQGMCVCQNCGFISYPSKWKSKDEIIQYYRKDYRPGPLSNNVFTCQRKIHFHNAFLNSVFKEWIDKKIEEPEIFEVGAAFGMALNAFREHFPKAKLAGTELTESFKRVAYHQFKINLQDDFDDTKKYDLIMSYKVAEHQMDVDREICRYASCLKDGGYLYISVPVWHKMLGNFGMGSFDLEYYLDPNHINVWTEGHFESLLAKAGFEIVSRNVSMYDNTYLCRVGQNVKYEIHREDPNKIKDNLRIAKQCMALQRKQKYKECIDLWPNFPAAWANYIEMERKHLTKIGWDEWFSKYGNPAIMACPESADIVLMVADFALRMENYPAAIKFCEISLRMKPEHPPALLMMSNIMREMALKTNQPGGREHYFNQAVEIGKHIQMVSMQHHRESLDIVLQYQAQIPIS